MTAFSLNEYSLNRESVFFKNTKFYHDIFHGSSHKCPDVYNSRPYHNLPAANSSISEQFNSYIKKITYSAYQMSQTNFNLFFQFMIHQWNQKKRLAELKKINKLPSTSVYINIRFLYAAICVKSTLRTKKRKNTCFIKPATFQGIFNKIMNVHLKFSSMTLIL